MKRTRRKPLSSEEQEQAAEFYAHVRDESCATCGQPWMFMFETHHVVEKQELRRRKLPLYNKRNALPLCEDCHERHTNASRRIPFRKLRPENISYAYEVLGSFAGDYLRRRYPFDG